MKTNTICILIIGILIILVIIIIINIKSLTKSNSTKLSSEKKMYDYTIIPLSELMVEDYRITAYHDKSMDRGGRIRIIIAEDR